VLVAQAGRPFDGLAPADERVGLVDLGTMQVLAYSSTGYIRSVFDMLPNWKFQPMILSGCAVPAIEELTFTAGQKSTTSP